VLDGIHLFLLIGNPLAPEPAPALLMDNLDSVQVTSSVNGTSFQIGFKVAQGGPIDRELLPFGALDPITTRVIICVVLRGLPTVLSDGIVTRHEVVPGNEPGQSTLTLTGDDLSVMMDLVELPFARYPAMPENVRVQQALARYSMLGITSVVIPPIPSDVELPIDKIPTQTGTDLDYIRELARLCGYVFFVEPGLTPGSSIAYWGPDIRQPVVQRALSVNLGPETNVESLSFSFDGKAPEFNVMTFADPASQRAPIPVVLPNLSILRPPMGLRPPLAARVTFSTVETFKLSPGKAARLALGKLFKSHSDAVTANGSLDVLRFGDLLRPRMMTGVRGAGPTYDGLYYVNSVTSTIKRGQLKQSFALSRDGLVSNVPRVVP
jgi:hypothetical protein